jgi:hypothetical protein
MLRHPVERAKSALSMRMRIGTISEQVLMSPDSLLKVISKRHFFRNSRPSEVWRRWTKYFGAERCRYFFLDDVATRPNSVRSQIAEFLGLESPRFKAYADLNRKRHHEKFELSPDSEEFLYEHYRDEILRCRDVFKSHALSWKTRSA